MIGSCISMNATQQYGLELCSDSHNEHSGHTIMGKEASEVPLGLGPPTNFAVTLVTTPCLTSGLDQSVFSLDQVEILDCYQNCLVEIVVQLEHCFFDNSVVEPVEDYRWYRKASLNMSHVFYIAGWLTQPMFLSLFSQLAYFSRRCGFYFSL